MNVRRAATLGVVAAALVLAGLGLLRAASPVGTGSTADQVGAVAATLRCPTCQGLSIEDSTSVLAAGSRRVIAQQLEEGRTPDEIRQWFVERYGESVLLSPDPSGAGLFAWLLPGLALFAGGALVWRWVHRGGAPAAASAVEDDAAAALAAWRESSLEPDGSPAGEELREALLARAAAEEEPVDGATHEAATARLAAAHRRFRARTATARVRGSGPALPRRAVTVSAAGVLLLAAGVGIALAVDRGSTSGAGGTVAAATSGAATGAPPEAPAGWVGGMPQTVEEWVTFGRAYDRDSRPDQAVAAYTMALQMQPDADSVLLMRADVLVRSGHPDQALPDVRQLDARHPDTPDVLLVLGLAQNRTGAPEGGATLRRFLELDPDSPAAPGVRHLLDGG